MIVSLVDRYILRAFLAYFIFSLLFLTSVLLFQQVTRLLLTLPSILQTGQNFALIFYVLIPKTLTFTAPMSCLICTLLGISKLRAGNELQVLQASGRSGVGLLKPAIAFGLFISFICFFVNVRLSPELLSVLNSKVSNISKQEISSAIKIGSFNTDFSGMNLYVKEGDVEKGEWREVFIVRKENDGERVITASTGRLDFGEGKIELVLNGVTSLQIPNDIKSKMPSLVLEKLDSLRIESSYQEALNSNKGDGRRLDSELLSTEELIVRSSGDSVEGRDAMLNLQRRFSLSFAPIVLTVAGFVVGLSFGRSSKIWGLVTALLLLFIYYLLFLIGEQLSRKGTLPLFISGWLSNIVFVIALIFWRGIRSFIFYLGYYLSDLAKNVFDSFRGFFRPLATPEKGGERESIAKPFYISTFILERSLLVKLFSILLITYITLVLLFVVFTFFELWKSIYENNISGKIVAVYLLNLLPYISSQVIGPCCLVASLVTYLLMVNRNEIAVWLSSGASIYKLLLPMMLFGVTVSITLFYLQEKIMPSANIVQDSLRSQIKTGVPRALVVSGKQWVAFGGAMYYYDFDPKTNRLLSPIIYSLGKGGQLEDVLIGDEAFWESDSILKFVNAFKIQSSPVLHINQVSNYKFETKASVNIFAPGFGKPYFLNIERMREQIGISESKNEETSSLRVALNRRYSDSLFPFVFALLGSGVALIFRRGKPFLPIISSVLLGVLVLGIYQSSITVGMQFGLPVTLICWVPQVLFISLGVYIVASLKT